jgi:hypothetical protein
MADNPFKIYKEISSVPTPYTPNAMYCVRAGLGIDIYVSNSTGTAIHKHNTGAGSSLLDILSADPANPEIGQQWLLESKIAEEGSLIAFYGAGYLTANEEDFGYKLSINTPFGIKRTNLS